MATIGSFKKVGNDYQGEIVTLYLQAKGVRIVAETNPSNDKAPSHRVFVGRAENCTSDGGGLRFSYWPRQVSAAGGTVDRHLR
jgi:uncharacterized protein (DUF736 family)